MIRRFCFGLFVLMSGLFLASCREEGILITDPTVQVYGTEIGSDGEWSGETASDESTEPGVLIVHICGAVESPGVYELEAGSRIYQLIELAGGFTADAADGYLNLAGSLSDGQKIVVPTVSEVASDPYGEAKVPVQTDAADDGLVNINTADKAKLMTLPGIGEAKALAIIAWRTEHGSFQTKEEIMQVSGIKEAAYEKIKTLITVD